MGWVRKQVEVKRHRGTDNLVGKFDQFTSSTEGAENDTTAGQCRGPPLLRQKGGGARLQACEKGMFWSGAFGL